MLVVWPFLKRSARFDNAIGLVLFVVVHSCPFWVTWLLVASGGECVCWHTRRQSSTAEQCTVERRSVLREYALVGSHSVALRGL